MFINSPNCCKYSGSRFCCVLVLNWCFRVQQAAVFRAHGHVLGCSGCFQSRMRDQASDWLNSFVQGGEKTQKSVDQHSFASNGLPNPSLFTSSACETYMIQLGFFQINPKAFVCWTATFKRDLCSRRVKLQDWKMMIEFLLDLASCKTGRAPLGVHSAGQPADERATVVQRLDTTHFYNPPVTLKLKSDDLIFAWSRKLHDKPTSRKALGVHCAGQPADERAIAVSKTGHSTLLLRPSHPETVRLGAKRADLPTW